MATEELTNLEKFVLDEVGTRTAQYAQMRDNPDLAAEVDDDDRATLLSYLDTGMTKILTLTGILRALPENKGTPEDPADAAEDIKNPRDLPPELWQALAYWVLFEWFTIPDPQLASSFRQMYEKETRDHRFSPGRPPTATRPFRSIA